MIPLSIHLTLPLMLLITLSIGVSCRIFFKNKLSKEKRHYLFYLILILGFSFFPFEMIEQLRDYPMSLHMIQHMIQLLLVPPLLLALLPSALFQQKEQGVFISKSIKILSNPILAYSIGMTVMFIVNWPMLSPELHNHQHAHQQPLFSIFTYPENYGFNIFLQITGGLIFSLPVFGQIGNLKLPALSSVLYLFLSCVGCSIIGIIISMKGNYLLIENLIESKVAIDMQVAGLTMWVPGCLIYISKIIIILHQFLRTTA